jgi:hypothetical protein
MIWFIAGFITGMLFLFFLLLAIGCADAPT